MRIVFLALLALGLSGCADLALGLANIAMDPIMANLPKQSDIHPVLLNDKPPPVIQ